MIGKKQNDLTEFTEADQSVGFMWLMFVIAQSGRWLVSLGIRQSGSNENTLSLGEYAGEESPEGPSISASSLLTKVCCCGQPFHLIPRRAVT